MAVTKEVLDELMKGYKTPEDMTGENGLFRQLKKALIERAMEAELTEELGYAKHDQGAKETGNRIGNINSPVASFTDILTVEGQAQFIQDFASRHNNGVSSRTDLYFNKYYTSTRAYILEKSGLNSSAVKDAKTWW